MSRTTFNQSLGWLSLSPTMRASHTTTDATTTDAVIAARALMRVLGVDGRKAVTYDPVYKRIGAAVGALGSADLVLREVERGGLVWGEGDLFNAEFLERAIQEATREVTGWRAAGLTVMALGES